MRLKTGCVYPVSVVWPFNVWRSILLSWRSFTPTSHVGGATGGVTCEDSPTLKLEECKMNSIILKQFNSENESKDNITLHMYCNMLFIFERGR